MACCAGCTIHVRSPIKWEHGSSIRDLVYIKKKHVKTLQQLYDESKDGMLQNMILSLSNIPSCFSGYRNFFLPLSWTASLTRFTHFFNFSFVLVLIMNEIFKTNSQFNNHCVILSWFSLNNKKNLRNGKCFFCKQLLMNATINF